MSRAAPEQIGGYRVIRRLSRGGMGEVWLASKDAHGFEKRVAIKVVLADFEEREEYRTLFFDEARLMARMSHPNLVQVFDFGEDEDHWYMVMEFVDGPSVEALMDAQMRAGKLLPAEVSAHIAAQAARGLHSAHTLADVDGNPLHVVHRDVSPQNIIVTRAGSTKLLDFGIARSNVRQSQTQLGIVRGKPGYMAPEQAKEGELDSRTDIFQLGIVLFELLTGTRLFDRGTVYASIAAIVNDPIFDPLSLRPDLDQGYVDILRCALEKDPDNRFSTADAFARALDSVISRSTRPMSEAVVGDHVRIFAPAPITAAQSAKARLSGSDSPPNNAATVVDSRGRATSDHTALISTASPNENGRRPAARRLDDSRANDDGRSTAVHTSVLSPGTLSPASDNRNVDALPVPRVIAASEPLAADTDDEFDAALGRPTRRRLLVAGLGLFSVVAIVGVIGLTLPFGSGAVAETDAGSRKTTSVTKTEAQPVVLVDVTPDAGGATRVVDPPRGRQRRRRARKPKTVVAVDVETVVETAPTPTPTEPEVVPSPKIIEMGFVTVVADPYGDVRVDGKPLGPTPVVRHRLEVGSHVVEVVAPDTQRVRYKKAIEIRKKKTFNVRVGR